MSAHELVDIVDDDNNVVDTVERHVMRERHLPHRASYIVVCDRSGRFLIELRTMSKDYAPGLFDACVGGVMQHGEESVPAARRELCEEIGIASPHAFTALGTFRIPYKSGRGFVYAYLYLAVVDAVTVRQADEVSGIMMLKGDEVAKIFDSCTYDSVIAFEEILRRARQAGLPPVSPGV